MGALIFSTAFSLFLLMDPFGNIPIYLSVLKEIGHKKKKWIVLREKVIALFIILIFAFFGNHLIKILNISHESIYLAGGIVLFVMAIKMIFPDHTSLADSLAVKGEPLIFPLAVPLVAGPSVLAAVMIYSAQIPAKSIIIYAILSAWVLSTLILLFAVYLSKWLGEKGINAIERLMGLILILIAINMFLQGITMYRSH